MNCPFVMCCGNALYYRVKVKQYPKKKHQLGNVCSLTLKIKLIIAVPLFFIINQSSRHFEFVHFIELS